MIDPRALVLTVFGLGFIKRGPGTWGSLFPCVVVVALIFARTDAMTINIVLATMCTLSAASCIALGRWAEQKFGAKDAQVIVADEVAGQCLALAFLPWRLPGDDREWLVWNLSLVVSAFVAFRIFDIAKPPPIRQVQDLPRGWGVLLDDVLAGLVASILVHAGYLAVTGII